MIDPTDQLEKAPATPTTPARHIALAHDWLVARRGGELVLDAIANALANHTTTNLYTMFDSGAPITPAIDALPRTVSPLNRYPAPLRRWLLTRYPSAVESLSRSLHHHHTTQPIDLLISTSSAAIKAMRTPTNIPHLCYCHTPARYLWSQTSQYTQGNFKAKLRALGLKLKGNTLRAWDKQTTDQVTAFIANSTHTADQIIQHYNRDSIVIHPPVRTDFFTPSAAPRTDQLLLVSALEPYKRVDLAIDAAAQSNRPLTIVGAGSHEKILRTHARRAHKLHQSKHPITFLGKIDDNQLRTLYQRANCFLFPQIEDFGITAVEAQACACPVVAYHAGGALDTVIDNETGTFFHEPTAEALADAIDRAPTNPAACIANAQQFSTQAFTAKMLNAIEDVLK